MRFFEDAFSDPNNLGGEPYGVGASATAVYRAIVTAEEE
jgi:hypothetical protein